MTRHLIDNRAVDGTIGANIDDKIRDLETDISEILGINKNVTITRAIFQVQSSGAVGGDKSGHLSDVRVRELRFFSSDAANDFKLTIDTGATPKLRIYYNTGPESSPAWSEVNSMDLTGTHIGKWTVGAVPAGSLAEDGFVLSYNHTSGEAEWIDPAGFGGAGATSFTGLSDVDITSLTGKNTLFYAEGGSIKEWPGEGIFGTWTDTDPGGSALLDLSFTTVWGTSVNFMRAGHTTLNGTTVSVPSGFWEVDGFVNINDRPPEGTNGWHQVYMVNKNNLLGWVQGLGVTREGVSQAVLYRGLVLVSPGQTGTFNLRLQKLYSNSVGSYYNTFRMMRLA